MLALGIDLGGTKIESQLFDHDWQVVVRKRVATPGRYSDLLQALCEQVRWADVMVANATGHHHPLPVGIGAAGLVNAVDGRVLAANLCASGKPLPADIERGIGRSLTYINDCRAFTLSESVFGAGQKAGTLLGLILGTGVGGGVCINGKLLHGASGTGGEFGHCAAPAALVSKYQLPLVVCGCGRTGCLETLISGTGLKRLAKALLSFEIEPETIAVKRHHDPAVQQVWDVWCELVGDLLRNLTLTLDPDKIVIGGGLSRIDGVVPALENALAQAQMKDYAIPSIVLAQGGDTSGARGAAYAAFQQYGNARD
ncbi:MAG: ROK family protein [Pseudomonadota bacterium]